jgi:hypothetical protein
VSKEVSSAQVVGVGYTAHDLGSCLLLFESGCLFLYLQCHLVRLVKFFFVYKGFALVARVKHFLHMHIMIFLTLRLPYRFWIPSILCAQQTKRLPINSWNSCPVMGMGMGILTEMETSSFLFFLKR